MLKNVGKLQAELCNKTAVNWRQSVATERREIGVSRMLQNGGKLESLGCYRTTINWSQ
jgi:hypothetical protein